MDDGSEMMVDLKFGYFKDFEPSRVARMVAPLDMLLEARSKLAELRRKLKHNRRLEELLQQVFENKQSLRLLERETSSGGRPTGENDTQTADNPNDEWEEVEEHWEGHEAEPGLLEKIISSSGAAHDEETHERTKYLIEELL